MPLTINTYPDQQSNKAQWNVTTDLSEDASHVNLRVRATIYGPAGTLGVIEQPKGSPAFDFTDMLYKFINYKTPALAPSGVFAQQLIPKVGSNLITDWTNDGTTPVTNYWDQGNNNLKFYHHSTDYGQVDSNNFSVTKGKMYCLLLKSGSISNIVQPADQVGVGLDIYKPDKLTLATLFECGRYILFAIETGTTCLRFGAHDGVDWYPTAVVVELYELADCDWYLPYQIVWAEVYETAAGVTTVIISNDCLRGKTGQQLFKAPAISTFDDYLCDSNIKKFLNPSLYLYPGMEKSQMIIKTPPSGQGSYAVWMVILKRDKVDLINGYAVYNDEGGVYVNTDTITGATSYQPIMALLIGNAAFTMTRFCATIYLRTNVTQISAIHYVYLNKKIYPRIIELMWLNQYGGFTTVCLSESLKETLLTERTDYQVPSDKYIKRRVSGVRECWLVECEGQILDPRAMDDIDLILSEYVLYSKVAGTFKEVYIREKETLIINNELINKLQISFEYAD